MKICKTCRYWSMEKKGFCHYENRGVGQFWHCDQWLAPGQGVEKIDVDNPLPGLCHPDAVNLQAQKTTPLYRNIFLPIHHDTLNLPELMQ